MAHSRGGCVEPSLGTKMYKLVCDHDTVTYTTALNDGLRYTEEYLYLRLSVVKLLEAPFAGELMNAG